MSRAATTPIERSEPTTFARVGSILLLDASLLFMGISSSRFRGRGGVGWRAASSLRRRNGPERGWRTLRTGHEIGENGGCGHRGNVRGWSW
jgi:hypothetical protein